MKQFMTLLLITVLAGCAYKGKNLQQYLNEPQSLIRDPHFEGYKNSRDEVESLYLKKKITYAEYLEKVKQMDEVYAKEVQERNTKITSEY